MTAIECLDCRLIVQLGTSKQDSESLLGRCTLTLSLGNTSALKRKSSWTQGSLSWRRPTKPYLSTLRTKKT